MPFVPGMARVRDPWWLDLNDPDLHGPTPSMLYHYTDAAGLTGFAQSDCRLLAANHKYVNDRDEIRFGQKIAAKILRRLDIDEELKALTIAKTTELLEEPFFIACFSADAHVLPQWRLYANDTAGYCLGFKKLESTSYTAGNYDTVSYTLRQCIYGAAKLQEQLEKRFRRKLEEFARVKKLKNVSAVDRNEVLADHLAQIAWRHAQLAKHEHFEFESEWRFVVWESAPEIEYRLTRRGLTPYLFTDSLKLEEVWIGPGVGPNRKKAHAAVSEFLAKHGLSPTVRHWKTSYRR